MSAATIVFQDRLKPEIQRLKRFIDGGGLGRPTLASARVKWYRPPQYYRESRWRGTRALDGGALMNQAIHTVDLLAWLLGPVKSVCGRIATRVHAIESEDTAVAVLEFANGALATLEAATSVFPGYPRRLEVTGESGTVVLEGDRVAAVDLRDSAGSPALAASPSDGGDERAQSAAVRDTRGHQAVLEDFIAAIGTRGGARRPPSCDGREGLRSLALVQAIYESARTGRPVAPSPGRGT